MKGITESEVYDSILEEGKTPLEIVRYLSESNEISPRGLLRQVYTHLRTLEERGHIIGRGEFFRGPLRKRNGLKPQMKYRVTKEGARNWLLYEKFPQFRGIDFNLEGA